MRYVLIGIAMMVFLVVSLAGFRGDISRKAPIELIADMDRQPKLRPLEPNSFFANGMSSQPLVKGTVRQSEAIPLADGSDVYPFETEHPAVSGLQTGTTNAVVNIPLEVSMGLMERGREKYTISCVPCHGGQGDGNGVVKYFGISAVKSLHDPDVVKQSDGDIYRTITLGKGVMKGYANTLSIEDRWAIVAYARALQLSRLGTEDEVPARFHVKETEEAETSAIAEEGQGK
jgi:mono/diheme cytochrome c family protein